MALTYGFYNGVNHDRRYFTTQFSNIVNAMITDGVFLTRGNAFAVTPAANGLGVNVDTGFAWFGSTWTENDQLLPLTLTAADVSRPRIDAIVLDVNGNDDIRANDIIVVTGAPYSTPTKPTLINEGKHTQHALAYVTVNANATSILAENIEIVVGQNETPYADAKLSGIDITALFQQWQGEFDSWFAGIQNFFNDWDKRLDDLYIEGNAKLIEWGDSVSETLTTVRSDFDTDVANWTNQVNTAIALWDTEFDDFVDARDAEFTAWFDNLQAMLDENVVTNLQNQITNLKDTKVNKDDKATQQEITDATAEKWIDAAGFIAQKATPTNILANTPKKWLDPESFNAVKATDEDVQNGAAGKWVGSDQIKTVNEFIDKRTLYPGEVIETFDWRNDDRLLPVNGQKLPSAHYGLLEKIFYPWTNLFKTEYDVEVDNISQYSGYAYNNLVNVSNTYIYNRYASSSVNYSVTIAYKGKLYSSSCSSNVQGDALSSFRMNMQWRIYENDDYIYVKAFSIRYEDGYEYVTFATFVFDKSTLTFTIQRSYCGCNNASVSSSSSHNYTMSTSMFETDGGLYTYYFLYTSQRHFKIYKVALNDDGFSLVYDLSVSSGSYQYIDRKGIGMLAIGEVYIIEFSYLTQTAKNRKQGTNIWRCGNNGLGRFHILMNVSTYYSGGSWSNEKTVLLPYDYDVYSLEYSDVINLPAVEYENGSYIYSTLRTSFEYVSEENVAYFLYYGTTVHKPGHTDSADPYYAYVVRETLNGFEILYSNAGNTYPIEHIGSYNYNFYLVSGCTGHFPYGLLLGRSESSTAPTVLRLIRLKQPENFYLPASIDESMIYKKIVRF